MIAILWKLFLGFLKVGLFSFGGAYAAIPLIREVVLENGWLTDAAFSDMIAVSESTPGPIMVNLATYVGSSQAGILGATVATLVSILPAFLIILIVVRILDRFMKNPVVAAVMDALKSAVIGIILAMGAYLIVTNLIPAAGEAFDVRALLITAGIAAAAYLPGLLKWKKLSSIQLIGVGAVLGIVVYAIP